MDAVGSPVSPCAPGSLHDLGAPGYVEFSRRAGHSVRAGHRPRKAALNRDAETDGSWAVITVTIVTCQCRHLIEHPMDAIWSLGPWPVSAMIYHPKARSARLSRPASFYSSSRPRY